MEERRLAAIRERRSAAIKASRSVGYIDVVRGLAERAHGVSLPPEKTAHQQATEDAMRRIGGGPL